MINSLTQSTPRLRQRHRAEKRFQWYGRLAIIAAIGFLVVMIGSIANTGRGALQQQHVALDVFVDPEIVDRAAPADANYDGLIKSALRKRFPDVTSRRDKRKLYGLVSSESGYTLRDRVLASPELIGQTVKLWFISSDDVDAGLKQGITDATPRIERRLGDKELQWISDLQESGQLESRFNSRFFWSGDSREPELAGIWSALVGSAWTLAVCFLLSFPVGILAAIYLEEYAAKGRWSDLIEVNINNLAAVPSIVFGLLGLAMFLNVFGMPRSSPLVGGLVLALMTLPTIIISSRAALRAVPPSIREAALGIGASRTQTTFHHVAPLALPGMLTGAIVGMARALGETAPLLMIGMVAFIVDAPDSVLEPATALPVQIFLWADSPERAFLEKTSAAIIVLLVFLVSMNLVAIMLRRKFQTRF
jgi:phosphate transport system permease protein